ncbi:MAG TPA: methyltransferase domain-containing protein [Archaeoglobus profundus]|nr:methyltransferase domain-containing protein [Archaeoglobus profundus]
MRLDKLLVVKGYFSSRQKAKEAIKRGFVIVNGKFITKPSTEVDLSANIVVLTSEKPRGYWKLKELDEAWDFIKEGDKVLDLGSSAGGFLLYASEKVGEDGIVYGIEISREFESTLREIEKSRKNVKIFIEDVFKFDISKLEPLDVILNDLTLDPISSLKAMLRFVPILKKGGKVLFVMKTGKDYQELDFHGFEVVNVKDAEDRREKYILLKRN